MICADASDASSLQVTAFALDGARGSVHVRSRFVRTPRFEAQAAAGESGGFPRRGAWTQATELWRNLSIPTTPANTSMLRWGGKLLALCEGGAPFEVHPETLETRGAVAIPGQLQTVLGFGAHFKIDSARGVLYNVGVQLPSAVRVFALSHDGRELLAGRTLTLDAGELAFVHDFAASQDHLVLFIPPWVASPLDALASVVGMRALGHTFAWQAGAGTRCVVLRKHDLAVVHDSRLPAFSTYHFANAWEEGSLLKVHVNRLIGDRAQLEANFSDMYHARWAREQYNELYEYTIDLSTRGGRVLDAKAVMPPSSGALPMEFPIVSHRMMGRKNRFVYTTAFSDASSTFFDAVQKYDLERGTTQTRRRAPGEFPSEVAFVPVEDKGAPEDAGFLLYVVYVAARHASDLYVLDAADFEGPPLCVCRLPVHVPYG